MESRRGGSLEPRDPWGWADVPRKYSKRHSPADLHCGRVHDLLSARAGSAYLRDFLRVLGSRTIW